MRLPLPDRISPHDLTAARVRDAFSRRARDIPDAIDWRMAPRARSQRARLESFRNRHHGEQCVIIASGPSLADTDLDLARDVPTFAMNRSYLLYDQWGFEPTYYVSINELVLSQFGGEIAALGMPKFVNHASRKALGPSVSDASIHFLRLRMNLRDSFTTDITQPVCSGGTVTFVCLELAHFMGFRSVVLVGLDHRFSEQGTPNSTATRSSDKDLSHAHPEYFPRGTTWQLPDLARSELAYEQARAAFEQVGGRVIDATPGGACPVFEKMGLAQALRSTPRL